MRKTRSESLDRRKESFETRFIPSPVSGRVRRAAACAASLLLMGAGGFLAPIMASAANGNSAVVVPVSGHLHATFGPIPFDKTLCDAKGGVYAPSPTEFYYSGTSNYTAGSFTGTAQFCGHSTQGVVRSDGSVPFVETDTFTGAVYGCGTGSFTFDVQGFVRAAGPTTQGLPGELQWHVVAGSGKGDLRALRSGGGNERGAINWNPPASDDSDFRGSVKCVPPSPQIRSERATAARVAKRAVTVPVRGTLNATYDAVPDRTLCDARGGVYAPGLSDFFYSGTSIYAGTFEGTGRFCGHTTQGVVGSDGSIPFIETDTFTGTVHGCGTGHVTYSVRGAVSSLFDPATQSLPAEEDWKIVARGGTEGLRGLRSGGGHNNAAISLNTNDAGTFMGSVKCVPSSR
jgi:hypothetical protein